MPGQDAVAIHATVAAALSDHGAKKTSKTGCPGNWSRVTGDPPDTGIKVPDTLVEATAVSVDGRDASAAD